MQAKDILLTFVSLRFIQYFFEKRLALLNRKYYLDPVKQKDAQQKLGISDDDLQKSLAYSEDKFRFSVFSGWIKITVSMFFLGFGGLGVVEAVAIKAAGPESPILTGLYFFGILALLAMLFSLPFSYFHTFVIEQKHGFNRQTKKGFVLDLLKGLGLGVVLGGLVLAAILWIMQRLGSHWWVYAWVAMSSFSILTAWLYPTFLAPLFNKFTPLEEGELKSKIFDLAQKVDFKTDGLYVMNASVRSSHGNAYFTGVFGKKRIVLFDTLIESLTPSEVVAVLAHELGHFKLHHVRWMLIRSVLMTGLTFFLLSLCLPLESFYQAFALGGISNYGALIVFTLWFGLVEFLLQPMEAYLSRRNEFAADAFALRYIEQKKELGTALLKLREKSHSMPLSHPLFSTFYYSHPPMLERLGAMKFF